MAGEWRRRADELRRIADEWRRLSPNGAPPTFSSFSTTSLKSISGTSVCAHSAYLRRARAAVSGSPGARARRGVRARRMARAARALVEQLAQIVDLVAAPLERHLRERLVHHRDPLRLDQHLGRQPRHHAPLLCRPLLFGHRRCRLVAVGRRLGVVALLARDLAPRLALLVEVRRRPHVQRLRALAAFARILQPLLHQHAVVGRRRGGARDRVGAAEQVLRVEVRAPRRHGAAAASVGSGFVRGASPIPTVQ